MILASAAGLMTLSGAMLTRQLLRPLQAFAVPVLRYRFTGPPLAGSPFNAFRVSGSAFAHHLDFLQRANFRIVTYSEALSNVDNKAFLQSRPIVLCFDGGYETLYRVIQPRLVEHGFSGANAFIATQPIGKDNSFETGGRGRPEPMLTAEQIKSLADSGWEIGSLGVTGQDLSSMSPTDLQKQLTESRQELEKISGKPVKLLAYPGDINISTQQLIIEQAGYDFACWISLDGLVDKTCDRFRLPRYPLNRKSQLIEVALVVSQRMV